MTFCPIAEHFFQGHVSLEKTPDAIRPWRLPFEEIELYTQAWWISWTLIQQAGESTGVRLRFRTNADRITLVCVPDPEKERQFDLVWENEARQTVALAAGESEVGFDSLPPGEAVVEIWLPHNAACAIRGFRLPLGSSLSPEPDSRKVLAVYGSSITHCQGAQSPSRTWPSIVARAHNLNLVCLGFSGQCHAHTLVARVLRDLRADLYLLKLGINICGENSLNGHTFMPNVAGMVRLIREKNPGAPIALISPIINPPREDPSVENAVGMSIPKFRDQLQQTVDTLRRVTGDAGLHYFDGRSIFGPADATAHQPDGCHPSASGIKLMGKRIAAEIIPALNRLES